MRKILVAGAGGIGERHIRCFLATNKTLVSICDLNKDKVNNILSKYKIESVYPDFSTVPLKSFDGIIIATPPNLHIPMATKCAVAGVPFLLEKPLSLDLHGVNKLKNLIKTKRLVSGVAYIRRSMQVFKKIKELIKSGIIGDLKMGRVNFSQDYAKYRPDYQKIYYAFKNMGGGCILDAASHMANLVEWYFGDAVEVVAFYDKMVLKKVECEDSTIILIRFKTNRAVVEIFINQFQKPFTAQLELIGTKGNIMYEGTKTEHKILISKDDSCKWKLIKKYVYTRDDPFICQAKEFLSSIENKTKFVTSIEEAENTLKICLSAKKSQTSNKIIKL